MLGNKQGIIDLATELSGDQRRQGYLKHLGDTYDIAGEVATEVIIKYGFLPLSSEEVAVAAGLHDIGRALAKDQGLHEIRGANWIRQNGLERSIAETLEGVERLAAMIQSHLIVAEQVANPAYARIVKELGIESGDPSLIPRTWNEAIIVYADLTNVHGVRVDYRDRLKEFNARYISDAPFIACLELARPRILGLCENVEKLKAGLLDEREILELYNFM
jgi:hypothetical protein